MREKLHKTSHPIAKEAQNNQWNYEFTFCVVVVCDIGFMLLILLNNVMIFVFLFCYWCVCMCVCKFQRLHIDKVVKTIQFEKKKTTIIIKMILYFFFFYYVIDSLLTSLRCFYFDYQLHWNSKTCYWYFRRNKTNKMHNSNNKINGLASDEPGRKHKI